MRRLTLALVALLPLGAYAQASGQVSPCAPSPTANRCDSMAHLNIRPGSAAGTQASVFVALVRIGKDGPDPSSAGWYGPRGWVASTRPTAAWTGALAPMRPRVRLPGGACGMVREAGGPAGQYSLYAGWGATDAARAEDAASTAARIRAAMHDLPASEQLAMQRQLNDLKAAQQRRSGMHSDSYAYAQMLKARTFWPIANFTCEGA